MKNAGLKATDYEVEDIKEYFEQSLYCVKQIAVSLRLSRKLVQLVIDTHYTLDQQLYREYRRINAPRKPAANYMTWLPYDPVALLVYQYANSTDSVEQIASTLPFRVRKAYEILASALGGDSRRLTGRGEELTLLPPTSINEKLRVPNYTQRGNNRKQGNPYRKPLPHTTRSNHEKDN